MCGAKDQSFVDDYITELRRTEGVDADVREVSRTMVVNAFADLGISEDQFEERYYTDILGELQG